MTDDDNVHHLPDPMHRHIADPTLSIDEKLELLKRTMPETEYAAEDWAHAEAIRLDVQQSLIDGAVKQQQGIDAMTDPTEQAKAQAKFDRMSNSIMVDADATISPNAHRRHRLAT